ncbi:MAG: hypothetical protein EOM11_08255 [Erysipelotrichia bacterium]|nr:hypothetical protein [Erysipelotrichia bacterium]
MNEAINTWNEKHPNQLLVLNRYENMFTLCLYNKKDGTHEIFTGKCEGEIAYEPLGSHGFGYDPIFYYPPFKTTLANVSEAEKNSISHRAIALKMLMKGMK